MRYDVWHGTNQEFLEFRVSKLGMMTNNSASRAAFFFAASPRTAWDYAQSAAKKAIPQQDAFEECVAQILEKAETAMAAGNFDLYERLICEAEDMEAEFRDAPPAGMRILRCEVDLVNPRIVSGTARDVVVNLGAVLDEARAAGHDGVIIENIHDTPSGEGAQDTHFAVFDPDSITILHAFSDPDLIEEIIEDHEIMRVDEADMDLAM